MYILSITVMKHLFTPKLSIPFYHKKFKAVVTSDVRCRGYKNSPFCVRLCVGCSQLVVQGDFSECGSCDTKILTYQFAFDRPIGSATSEELVLQSPCYSSKGGWRDRL